jgi:predicted RecB family endonuclease
MVVSHQKFDEDLKKMAAEKAALDQKLAEGKAELDRRLAEEKAELDRRLMEMAEDDKRRRKDFENDMKDLDRRIGELTGAQGRIVEQLLTPNLAKKFRDLDFSFTRFSRHHEIEREDGSLLAEIDVFVENGDYALAVEVKNTLSGTDIRKHLHRMEVLRRYADAHGDKRKYIGAVAAPAVDKSAHAFAHRVGFFVIEASEDAVNILPPPGQIREW